MNMSRYTYSSDVNKGNIRNSGEFALPLDFQFVNVNLLWRIEPLLGNDRETTKRPLLGNRFLICNNWTATEKRVFCAVCAVML
jgi:hypothetical protein